MSKSLIAELHPTAAPLSDGHIDELSERSKDDLEIIVGSEVRILCLQAKEANRLRIENKRIVGHAQTIAAERDELRFDVESVIQMLERELAEAEAQRNEMKRALSDLTDAFGDYGGTKHSTVYTNALKALGWDAP